jgi:hypothetical protein
VTAGWDCELAGFGWSERLFECPMRFLDTAGPPNRLVPVMSSALSVGFCALAFGTLGAFVPERPGVPVYDFLNLSLPMAM